MCIRDRGIAAGVAMVGSVVWVLQTGTGAPDSTLALRSSPTPASSTLQSVRFDRSGMSTAALDEIGADAAQTVEFEPYVAAHKQFQMAAQRGPAAGFLRSAVHESR